MGEDSEGDGSAAVNMSNTAGNPQETPLVSIQAGPPTVCSQDGKRKTCTKCGFDFVAAKGKGNFQICRPCRDQADSPQLKNSEQNPLGEGKNNGLGLTTSTAVPNTNTPSSRKRSKAARSPLNVLTDEAATSIKKG